MSYAVLAVGFLLAVTGMLTAYHGYGIIEIERGWTAVIAGVVALAGGLIIVVLGLILRLLGQIKQTLESAARMETPSYGIPVPDELPFRAGLDLSRSAAAVAPAMAGAALYETMSEPVHVRAPLMREEFEAPLHQDEILATEPSYPDLTPDIEAALQEELARSVIAPRQDDWLVKLDLGPAPAMAPEPMAEEDLLSEVDDVSRAAAALAAPINEVGIPQHEVVQDTRLTDRYSIVPDDLGMDDLEITRNIEAAIFAEMNAEMLAHEDHGQAVDREIVENQAFETPVPTELFAPAWHELEPEIAEPHEDIAFPPPPEPLLFESEAREREIPSLEVSPEPVAEPEPIVEIPAEPEPAPPPPEPEKTMIGRYEADGTTYIMFSDGSIEAHSEQGVARFKSMAELKAHMESEAT